MSKPLSKKLREKWNCLIETEGKSFGLSECYPFLENKMVNDVFYEGKFKGRDCIVKCSSKAPDSIENEYQINKRLFDVNRNVFPEPLAYYVSEKGDMAFLVTEKISAPDGTEAISIEDDFIAIAKALKETGIVHRDIFHENLLLGKDGHYKLIDFQFAIDRNDYHESKWMLRNWKFRFVVFGVNRDLPHGEWNDFYALARSLEKKSASQRSLEVVKRLRAEAPDRSFKCALSFWDRLRIAFYGYSLSLQMLFRKPGTDKYARLKWRREAACR